MTFGVIIRFFLLLLFLFVQGCSSHTTLISSDREATILVPNWNMKSQSVLIGGDRQPVWHQTSVIVQKSGCASKSYTIAKYDDVAVMSFLSGFLTYGVGFLWSGAYLPRYQLEFECETESLKSVTVR